MPSQQTKASKDSGVRMGLRLVDVSAAAIAAVVVAGAFAVAGSSTVAAGAGTHAGGPVATQGDPLVSASATPAILAPPDAIVGESDGTVDFVVRLAEEGTNTVTVAFETVSGTAAGGNGVCNGDFEHTNGTLTFTPGQTEKLVPIEITDCLDDEGFEGFALELSGATGGGVVARASARISIIDDDNTVDSPHLHVRDAVVDEKDGTAFVSVLLGGPNGQASLDTVTVDYQTSNGTASAGSDFAGVSGTLTFAPGETAKTVPVEITPDIDVERAESFTITLSNPDNATLADSSGTIAIGSSDAAGIVQPAVLAPADVIVGETDGFVDLVVKLPVPGLSTVSVDYTTQSGTAGGGNPCNSDFTVSAGTLVFAPGETTKVVRVQIVDCPVVEPFEAFTFELSGQVNSTIGRESGRISIVDNDTVAATPTIHVRDAVVDEKDGVALVSVLLGGAAGQASASTITVNYTTSNGTASASSDYTAELGTLTFAPGETAKTVPVTITDDGDSEPAERFALSLSSALNGAISDDTGVVTIGASDQGSAAMPHILAPADTIVSEADGFVDLVVRLSTRSESTVTVDYTTQSGTANGGNPCNADFTIAEGKLVFAPGETTKVVRVQIVDCPVVELFEGFTLELSAPLNGTIGRASGRISIVDNDTVAATPRLHVRDAVVDEKDGMALVSVVLGGLGLASGQASLSTVTVDYATANDTASAGSDYTAETGTLTFAPGETTKTVPVMISDDGDGEPSERFSLTLSSPLNAEISDGSGVVEIGASDQSPAATPSILAPTDRIVGEADGYVDLVVKLSARSLSTVEVAYTTESGTANGGNPCNADFTIAEGKLVFAPGETTKVVRVQIVDCPVVEAFEGFTFELSAPVNSTIGRASGRISIVDNDTTVPTPTLQVRDVSVDEKAGVALVSVLLGGLGSPSGQASLSSVTVDYQAVDGSATGGSDYTATSGTLTFAPGETTKTVVIPIADDGLAEPTESFTLGLSNATNATIGDGTSLIVIGASDLAEAAQPGIFAPADVVVGERDGYVDLVVRLSEPGTSTVAVDYTTVSETASGGNPCNADFTIAEGKVVFAPGETTKVVRVQIVDCPVVENLETFRLQLSGALNGVVSRVSGRVTILDNTTGPTLASLAVTPVAPSIAAGADQQFMATGTFTDASTADLTGSVTWASASPSVATISAGGLAHGLTGGASTISATLGSLSDSTLLTVIGGKSSQTITFAALPNKTYGDPDFTVSATASSGLPVGFAAAGNCTISGQAVHITGAGSCTLTASQPGNAEYTPAPSVARTFSIARAAQAITFAPLADKSYGDPDFTVSATASSGLPVSFTAGGSCTVNGTTVHITGAGSCTLTAAQPGNANYLPAPDVAHTFAIAKAGQTITFAALANKRLGDPDFAVTASASSGLAVALAASGNCTVTAALVHLTGAGSCTITASQPGNANYNAAPAVSRTFSIRTQPPPPPPRCRVPRVISKQLAAAKATIAKRHCRTGKVTRVYSKAKRKGVVIGQSRRPGRVLPANSKIDLVVSRGRRK